MTATDLIRVIDNASSVTTIFPDLHQWYKTYKDYSKLIHPDICSEPGSAEAFRKLNDYKREIEHGKEIPDDAGSLTFFPTRVEMEGDEDLIKISMYNHKVLLSLTDKSTQHFKQYIPESSGLSMFKLRERAVPLANVGTLKQEHVNFILSRMLEFVTWVNGVGWMHAGINPSSIAIIPHNHGMQCVSFYHMARLGGILRTVSGRYAHLYPATVFRDKKAGSNVDLELAKRTAVWLLGDKSGIGNSLRRTHNPDFLNFIRKDHWNPLDCYKEYREMLSRNYDTRQFHILNL